MNLAKQIDKLYALREERVAIEKQETELREQILAAMHAAKQDTAQGQLGLAKIRRSEVPQLTDEEAFFAFARKKDNREVMRVNVVTAAWRARVAAGETVPGVDSFVRDDLVISRAK